MIESLVVDLILDYGKINELKFGVWILLKSFDDGKTTS